MYSYALCLRLGGVGLNSGTPERRRDYWMLNYAEAYVLVPADFLNGKEVSVERLASFAFI